MAVATATEVSEGQIALPRGPRGGVGYLVLPSRAKLARELAQRSDADLLALTGKDPDAFGVFYLRHYEAILSYLARYTGNADVAADMAAEVFADAFDGVGRFDPKRGVPRQWLFGIAKKTLLASYRRGGVERSARRKLGLTVEHFDGDLWDQVESRLDAAIPDLVAGLDRLSETEREAVIARIVDERDYAEIALDTDSSEAAVRQRVSRGLTKLGRFMKRGDQ